MNPAYDIDKMAARIHQFYCDLALAEGWTNDFPMPYADLPEFMKEDNRSAARRIGEVLALGGLYLQQRIKQTWDATAQKEVADIIDQHLELLAEGEHDGWNEARIRQGWRIGKEKNIPLREHHLLKPYADLTEKEKNKDRDSVRKYVTIIEPTEFRISKVRTG